MLKHIAFILLAMAVFAAAKPGDFNCDGYVLSTADMIFLVNILNSCGSWAVDCDNAGDLDADGVDYSIADIYLAFYLFSYSRDKEFIYFTAHPQDDTLKIGTVTGSPGEQVILPVYLTTVDTLSAFQYCITGDLEWMTIDTIITAPGMEGGAVRCAGFVRGFGLDTDSTGNPMFLLPGSYHIADLYATVKDHVVPPADIAVVFFDYTPGLGSNRCSNATLFRPVLINGEIIVTAAANDMDRQTTSTEPSLDAYPNPFNSSVNFAIECAVPDELVIYDVAGREITSIRVLPGRNTLTWGGTDRSGNDVSAGVYFAQLRTTKAATAKKLIYLK